ncbi:MAG TPA: response regulator [Microcoleaceae cyanobacterium]
MRILIVEDDEFTAKALSSILSDQNYAVETTADGETGWELVESFSYDLILLDVMLPKLDGISLCQRIRSRGLQVPILLLTGRDTGHDKAIGLDAGADDYVVKPFNAEELVARIRALLRRGGAATSPVLEWGSLRLDPSTCEVSYGARLLPLTPKEYALLELFLRNHHRVYSCSMILEHLWSFEDTPGEEAVRTHIKGLRQKLKAAGAPTDVVETVYGIGYRLKPIEEVATKAKKKDSLPSDPLSISPETQQKTLAAIADLWKRFQDRIYSQLAVLEQAIVALTHDQITEELRQQAERDAHSLAGALGSFGLTTGSKLARKIEHILREATQPLPPNHLKILPELLATLRQTIDQHQAASSPPSSSAPSPPLPSSPPPPTPHPDNEAARLLALRQYQILDTAPESTFDDLVDLAVQISDTTIAWISLIDADRQWFKSKLGIEATELPRHATLCAYTILHSDMLIIPDTAIDSRFMHHPLVTAAPNIRFYAGVPLITSDGYALGTLAVLDPTPQTLSPKQITALQTLGRQVMTQLELHRHLVDLASTTAAQQRQEQALRKTKDETELRVAERTAELVSVNRRLQLELEERKRIEAALRVSQARFAGILEIADDAIISVDQTQCITLFNQGAEKIFGYTAREALGQPLDILLPIRAVLGHRQHVKEFGQATSPARRMGERGTIYGRRKNGEEFPAEASISKLEMGDDRVYTVILRDISDREMVERMKDEFISVVSHELRTPLTSIHGSLRMLASGLLNSEPGTSQRLLQIAVESTDRLVRLINDVLDIERIESGKVHMELASCDSADLISQAVNIIQPIADKAGITLSVSTTAVELQADGDRVIQTLTNLLSNAIKFSPRGNTVWLSAALLQPGDPLSLGTEALRHQTTEQVSPSSLSPSFSPSPSSSLPTSTATAHILFTVKDQGRGIPTDKLGKIFERFQQVDASDSRNQDGTGLGLAICRSIVQQHGGDIWVESELGQGSSFHFTLPLSPDVSGLIP